MTQPLLILGASCRAAAFSALRGGWQPLTADLFADADLTAVAPVVRIDDYPAGLARAAAQAPPAAWLYTGALENYPRLIARIARRRELLGNGAAVLAAVRDPLQLAEAFSTAGVKYPEVRRRAEDVPAEDAWLAKPLRGAGGTGISVFRCEEQGGCYYQQRIAGSSRAAIFLGHTGGAALWGVTEQLIGAAWCGARPFHYCGSLGPLALTNAQQHSWQQIGNLLVRRFGLRGLFGVDAIENDAGIWPVEVNPRYAASVEIHEWAALANHDPAAASAIALHIASCTGKSEMQVPLPAARDLARDCYGKAILFATVECRIPESFTQGALAASPMGNWPRLADIPPPGTHIAADQPILTAFARGPNRGAVLGELQRQLDQLRTGLY